MLGSFTAADLDRLQALLPFMSVEEKLELSRLLEKVPPRAPYLSLREFVGRVNPNYRWWWYNSVLCDRLQDVAEGRIKRLMVFMPPRHGKSELTSKLFPAYYSYRFPERKIGLVAYNEDRAHEYLSHAQDYYVSIGGQLRSERERGKKRGYEVEGRGGMWAAGMGGSLTGLGFHLGVIDDPVKNAQEASSPVIQKRFRDWYPSTFYSRREPNAAIVLINTRWHPNDPSAFLLEKERRAAGNENDPIEGWHVIVFDAERDAEPYDIPSTCTMEPDPRAPGEFLSPERFPPEEYRMTKLTSGPYVWNALWQQRPKPPEGNEVKREWLTGKHGERLLTAIPTDVVARVVYLDLAGTDKKLDEGHDPDYTVGILMSRLRDGRIVVEGMVRGQWSPGTRDAKIRLGAVGWAEQRGGRQAFVIWHEREAGIGGGERQRELAKALHGFDVHSDPPIGDKPARRRPFNAQAEAGNVYLLKGDWNEEYLDEICALPFASHDDIGDANAGAYGKLSSEVVVPAVAPVTVPLVSPYTV